MAHCIWALSSTHGGVRLQVCVSTNWAEGGAGAAELARAVVELCEAPALPPTYVYDDADSLTKKVEKIATKIYRASAVTYDAKVRSRK